MQVNRIANNLLTNKTVLNGLEKISEHGTSFVAGASLLMSLGVRTVSIYNTPDVKKENRFYAMANSITSGLVKFGIIEAVALPIENAVNRIDKNSSKYLTDATLKNFSPETRSYKFITQIIKLSTGLLTAIPKSILTIALIPVVMNKVFHYNPLEDLKKAVEKFPYKNNSKKFFTGQIPYSKQDSPTFTGNIVGDKLSGGIASIINNKKVQKLAQKYELEDGDIYKHITAMTDVLLTSAAVWQTNKSDSIKENCKRVLNYNNIINTAITIIAGYWVDNRVKNRTDGFMEKFKELNKSDPKLPKYIEGINILRPAVIFALIYYTIVPIFSTYTSEKLDKFLNKKSDKQ